ncbi:histone deacetylase 8-like [Topomyia yanbarensis]|uniref:histone deacetylase 8-like n=1 Tax=Topomyia yanbarensis TaxID=2498891 RepID=UPI00273C8D1F|nr:histone deacetylase 8-like [Topomyia yanbarensis]
MSYKNVVYVSNISIHKEMRKLSAIKNRSEIVDELIKCYGLFDHCRIVESNKCSLEDLLLFHSADYIQCLKRYNDIENTDDVTDELQEFGIAYDCPLIENIYEFVSTIAGSTIAAVNAILDGALISINWHGGWHHAQRDSAAGFCYVNDVVIAVQQLRTKFQKVLYLDLDVHHGDGVESAFSFSKYVMTVSFHLHEPGYFPGTGNISEIGFGSGKGYTINAPYARNISGELFVTYFEQIASAVFDAFQPNVCIVQCGGDIIAGDRLGGANVLPKDCKSCIKKIIDWRIPTLLLGGGGYNINTAKYWTELTACILDVEIARDIPDNKYFLHYGPDFVLDVYPTNSEDRNTSQDLTTNVFIIKDNLKRYVMSSSSIK